MAVTCLQARACLPPPEAGRGRVPGGARPCRVLTSSVTLTLGFWLQNEGGCVLVVTLDEGSVFQWQ